MLSKTHEVYLKEEKICKSSLELIDWYYETIKKSLKYLMCSDCSSKLIEAKSGEYPNIALKCRSCSSEFLFENKIENIVSKYLDGDLYEHMKNGAEVPYESCPDCQKNTFVRTENSCVYCQYEKTYQCCSRCDRDLDIDEQDFAGRCGYCQRIWEKIQAE